MGLMKFNSQQQTPPAGCDRFRKIPDPIVGSRKEDCVTQTKMTSGQRRESILELAKLMDSSVRVKCLGGRELQGILRGYDELVNLVLDDCIEYVRGASNHPDALLLFFGKHRV